MLAARQGLKTAIVDLSEGEKSTLGTPSIRQKEKAVAAERLRVTERLSLGLPDTQIGMSSAHEALVISCIRELRPRLVLAPYHEDRHPDHTEAARLIKRSVFFSGVGEVGGGQPHRVERLLHYCIHQPFTPSLVFDVTSVWPEYENGLAAYQSQFFASGANSEAASTALADGHFLRSLEGRGRHYGAMINAEYGEPYFSPAPLSFESPSSLLRSSGAKVSYGSFR